MQLTKLEIKGFKSFADRVVINFDEGITGIVGPNGCGKSNVVDSIRWVLGEQKSRVLRSDKMENVIFNGTKARKPTQLAEVSLTFNNTKNLIPTEYAQVTITRRYYRSGESEYLLNGITCRLKDITNLFLDTGIASNSYAIIELKMVDDILNDKDNSRRALFEEAAGISKFKIRKKETLRKLSDTDADLERVEDLLFEIEKNLKSLERQATQAKKYYELKDEYKHSSIALAKKAMGNQQEHFDTIQQQIQEENDKRLALNALVNEKEAAIEKAKSDLINKEKLLSSRQKTLNEHVSKIRQYESDKKIKNERQKFLHDKIETLKEQISQDKQSSERAAVSLEGLRIEAKEAEKEVNEILTKVEKLKSDYEAQKNLTTEGQENLNSLNQYYSEKKDHQFQLSKEIEIKDIQLRSMMNELDKTSEDSSEKSANIEEFKGRLEEIGKEKEEKQGRYDQLKNSEEHLKDQIAQTEEGIEKVRTELTQVNRSLDAKQNEYSLTKSLVDNLEGFPEAIKFLKKNPKWKDAPLLSDILTCPEEYRITIENFLEPFMNYYIVDTQDDALKAVNLLSESTRGKANFFILENLLSYKSDFVEAPAGSKPALELIDYDSRYENLIKHLLWNVFITPRPEKSDDSNIVVLDKEGKVTFRRYSMSGGSIGLFEGKRIGRAKNLEKLDKEIKDLKKKQAAFENEIAGLQTKLEELRLSSKANQLDEVKEELARIKEVEVSVQTKQDQFLELLSSNKNRREDIQQQIVELEKALKELKPQAEKEILELNELAQKVEVKKEEALTLQEALDLKSAAYNEENVIFHQKQNKLNSILQEITYKEESYNNSLQRIEKNNDELGDATSNLNELVKKSIASDDELISMYEEKESLESGVNEAEKEYYEARGLIDDEEKNLRETQRKREGIDHALMEWQNKLNDAKMGLNSVKDRLSVEFNIDLEKIKEEEVSDYKKFTEEELRTKVDKLRNRLDNMGPINPMAMEAFEEIKERHTFITDQKEDLINAKESLLTTISEIDEVAKETFMEAFQHIKDNFIKVFRTLFTEEDDCDLILTTPDQPLESSIDIIAKPKGKRPLTINQLSGGEKTLTATSLLFSIYLLKPAPFCIFDEVDAPLDDANIDKFNEIIRKFSKESQFIIVTHNKRTMASTDVIYGVTMQEQGVSKVVPVDLRELA
ncbi:condensin subunit Smc [Ekhidna lutea]|uniref:Chromosome partition protein Smc n=1 Tax=Ekhidna lutea TaxID=447679 RepID=A0A239H4R5_EKHLU|nr:chromosome segregation protein SMC [Ekhidna lutea]SNS76202.1 condensin subunit Smc [Ekhidna lutea]